jgi:hypothetical protein
MSFTKQDIQTIEFVEDKLKDKNCSKLLKSVATLKEKIDKVVKHEEIKDKKY